MSTPSIHAEAIVKPTHQTQPLGLEEFVPGGLALPECVVHPAGGNARVMPGQTIAGRIVGRAHGAIVSGAMQ